MISVKFDSGRVQDAMQKAIHENITRSLQDTIKPFEGEIRREGGKVTISVPKDLKNMKLQIDGLSDELVVRIRKAFN